MRFVAWLVVSLLVILTAIFALVTLGAFATLNPATPLWLRSLGSVESALYAQLGLGHLHGFLRALLLALLTSLLAGLAAYVKPRR